MIKLIVVGKIKESYLVNMIEDYLKRINKYHHLEIVELPDSNIEEEGQQIIKNISKKGYNVVLAIHGTKLSSVSFAKFIETNLMEHANINFIIGGSDGISTEVLDMVDYKISFSDLTFPHGLFRGVLLEQIYRAFKIINNETYHKWGIMEDLIYVVGTAFVKDGKLLISMSQRSSKKGKFTLVGGGVEKGETYKEAARRECIEEIANGFDIREDELKEILCFREPALSDPTRNIEMHMMLSLKDVDVELKPNDEIIEYRYFSLGDDEQILASAIRDHFIPWAKENKIMY